MNQRRHILGISTFVLISAAVVFNALYLQGLKLAKPRSDASRAEPGETSVTVAAYQAATADGPVAVPSATVVAIQRELESRGYAPGAAVGTATVVTRAAILAFEQDAGLPLTAEPSDIVLQALILGPGIGPDAPAAKTARPGPEAEKLIAHVQRDLAALGYGPFAAQGRLGEDTARAIAKFERDQNMTPGGRITAPLVARLLRAAPREPKRPAG